jgi:hypothetical protein
LTNADTQVELVILYENGQGVPKNDLQALNWYRKAADQGYVLGEYNLGTMFFYGNGVAEDNEQAAYWFRKAADQGYDVAQYLLGNMYQHGLGVPQNIQQAIAWYRKAAEQGHAEAIENLKNLRDDEPGVPPDGEGFWDYGNYTYQGTFENAIPNGWGTMTWSGDWEGHTYTGEFVNSQRHGFGTYTYPDGTIQSGRFENNVFKEAYVEEDEGEDSLDLKEVTMENDDIGQHHHEKIEIFSSIEEIILHYANKKIAAMRRNFFIANKDYRGVIDPKFEKKVINFYQAFSDVYFKKIDVEIEMPILFYDGTILGSGKDGIIFTEKSIFAKGCLGRGVKHVEIEYDKIVTARISTDKVHDKEILIESSGHLELIILKPIYASYEDLAQVVEMIVKIQSHLKGLP